jgi:hypothetical protein
MSLSGSTFVPQGPTIPGSVNYDSARLGSLSLGKTVNQYKTGTLTLAQILDLYNTPVPVLPALATGYMYVVDKLVLEAIYGSAAYSGGGPLYLQYGVTAHGANSASASIAAAFLTGLSADSVISATGAINNTTGLVTSVTQGAPLTLTASTAVFTAGTGGSAVYQVVYRIVPVA